MLRLVRRAPCRRFTGTWAAATEPLPLYRPIDTTPPPPTPPDSPLLPFLHLALQSNDLVRARRVLQSIRTISPSVLRDQPELDRRVTHAFIEAYFARGGARMAREALHEWRTMEKRGVSSTRSTYAVMLRGL